MGNVVTPLWEEAGAATRHIVVAYPVLSLATTLAHLTWLFSCIPLHYMYVQTFFISCFARPLGNGFDFLMVLLEMYMAFTSFSPKEKELGSSAFLWWMMYANFLKNVVFVAFGFILSVIFPMYLYFPSGGIWSLIVMLMAVRVAESPDAEVNVYGFQITCKMYLFALVAILCLMSQTIVIDVIAAAVVGLVYKRFKLDRFHLNREWALKFEKLWPCCRIWKHGGQWIAPGDGDAFLGGGVYNNVVTFNSGAGGAIVENKPQASFQAFSGAGHRLGSETPQGAARELQPAGESVARTEELATEV